MRLLIIAVAWFAITMSILAILVYPFYIGKEKQEKIYSASGYIVTLLEATVFILLAGRCLGWF